MSYIKNKGWHDWNIASQKLFDQKGNFHRVSCSVCKMQGKKRDDFGIHVNGGNYKKVKREYCVYTPSRVKRVILLDETIKEFGFKVNQIVETVPCPKKHQQEYGEDLWIFSVRRNESIRLLPFEYKIV